MEEHKTQDTRLRAKISKKIFKSRFTLDEAIMPQILEVPLEQMEEEPFNNLLLPFELEEDPFIEQ